MKSMVIIYSLYLFVAKNIWVCPNIATGFSICNYEILINEIDCLIKRPSINNKHIRHPTPSCV
jgi:hypothetical protein